MVCRSPPEGDGSIVWYLYDVHYEPLGERVPGNEKTEKKEIKKAAFKCDLIGPGAT